MAETRGERFSIGEHIPEIRTSMKDADIWTITAERMGAEATLHMHDVSPEEDCVVCVGPSVFETRKSIGDTVVVAFEPPLEVSRLPKYLPYIDWSTPGSRLN